MYKRQAYNCEKQISRVLDEIDDELAAQVEEIAVIDNGSSCLLYTSDAADERSSVDLGGRRIIKKKKKVINEEMSHINKNK